MATKIENLGYTSLTGYLSTLDQHKEEGQRLFRGQSSPKPPGEAIEEPGRNTARRFPLRGQSVILCEAKAALTCELIGQALVYRVLANRAGAALQQTITFAEAATPLMREVAEALGLTIVVQSLEAP